MRQKSSLFTISFLYSFEVQHQKMNLRYSNRTIAPSNLRFKTPYGNSTGFFHSWGCCCFNLSSKRLRSSGNGEVRFALRWKARFLSRLSLTRWWFLPIWNILVNWDHFPKKGWKIKMFELPLPSWGCPPNWALTLINKKIVRFSAIDANERSGLKTIQKNLGAGWTTFFRRSWCLVQCCSCIKAMDAWIEILSQLFQSKIRSLN